MDRATPKPASPPSPDEWFLSIYVDPFAEKHHERDLSRVTDLSAPGPVPSSHCDKQGQSRVAKGVPTALPEAPHTVPCRGTP